MVRIGAGRKSFRPLMASVKREAEKVLRTLKLEKRLLNIFLVDRKVMRKMNGRWRGEDRATNILSFPEVTGWPSLDEDRKGLGDIFLAPVYFKKKEGDIQLIIIHGILHLIGYRHNGQREAKRMERKEEEVRRIISNS